MVNIKKFTIITTASFSFIVIIQNLKMLSYFKFCKQVGTWRPDHGDW